MNEQTSYATTALELLVPPFADDGGDWQEILRLAAASSGPTESAATSRASGARRAHRWPQPARLSRPFFSVWRVAAIGVCAAGLLALVAVWPFRGESSVLGQALAALGSGQLTHVVLEGRLGDQMIDLRSGKRTAVHGRIEIWYDPQHGLVEALSFRGGVGSTLVITPSEQSLLQDTFPSKFVTGYRAALRTRALHVTGSGTVNGTPVYWIESKPTWQSSALFPGAIRRYKQQIAVSKTTYKPIFIRLNVDGHVQPGSGIRVVSIDTIAPQTFIFTRHHTRPHTLWGITPTSPAMTLAQARSSMRPRPLIPPATIAGIRRSGIAEPAYLAGPMPNAHQIPGVRLIYGRVGTDPSGGPTYNGPFISITEFPTRNAAVLYTGLSYFPDANRAVLENTTATLKTHGLYVIINASSPQLATAAARALVNP